MDIELEQEAIHLLGLMKTTCVFSLSKTIELCSGSRPYAHKFERLHSLATGVVRAVNDARKYINGISDYENLERLSKIAR